MNDSTSTIVAPPRIVHADAMLISRLLGADDVARHLESRALERRARRNGRTGVRKV
jgi:hypothetical protein